ncbi:MAG: S41 family peptidase [Candidatus Bipolaricaulis sp.]|nr:S41 family peptidase [Candidatus Bipolaricaulis sp.]
MTKNQNPVNSQVVRRAVLAVAEHFEQQFYDASVAAQIGARLRQQLADGAYDDATSPGSLASALADDVTQLSDDRHLGVGVLPPDRIDDGQSYVARLYDLHARSNFGFRRVEMLPGSVGYVDVRLFCPADVAGPTAVAAMNFLARARALIFDLRKNGGGEDGMERLLSGYLFGEATELCSIHHRGPRGIEQSRSLDYVPGPRLVDVPAYVLTSRRTFSVAEGFTYNLQQRGRATVVGEQTRGGGHTIEIVPLPESGLELYIPEGEAINPISQRGWEGVGVTPDIAVPAGRALDVAYRHALEKLRTTLSDPDDLFSVDWVLDGVRAALEPVTIDSETLSSYVGTYGHANHVRVRDGALYVEHAGYAESPARPLAVDLFEYEDGASRVRFERENGKVHQAVCLTEEGLAFVLPRT